MHVNDSAGLQRLDSFFDGFIHRVALLQDVGSGETSRFPESMTK
jgi:hypothetical protein